jgi:hypothetical protein
MTVGAGWLGREGDCNRLAAGTGALASASTIDGSTATCTGSLTGGEGSMVGATGRGDVGAIGFTGGSATGLDGTPGMGAPTPHRMVFAPPAGLGADGWVTAGAAGAGAVVPEA